jgi:hypothetical protein
MSLTREYAVSPADLKRMREAEMGTPAIAAVYGCDPSTVRHWLIKFGLPTRRERIAPPMDAIERAIRHAEACRRYRQRQKANESATIPNEKDDA